MDLSDFVRWKLGKEMQKRMMNGYRFVMGNSVKLMV